MINTKIIADSVARNGKRITTFELEYPRFIHSEFLTHRMLSRNAASSRAIPLSTMIKLVWNNPAIPVQWGKNQSGMQAKEELEGYNLFISKLLWNISGKVTCVFAWGMNKLGLHKQIANRILEPWSHIKVVVTATDWDNFFYLRNHPDAQPEIHELAMQMYEAYSENMPVLLTSNEWHLPYVGGYKIIKNSEKPKKDNEIRLKDAIKLSASLCAQVSYRKADISLDKALKIYDRLIESKPCHSSPFEHQARPTKSKTDRSGNFSGWLQYRQLIPFNNCEIYIPE